MTLFHEIVEKKFDKPRGKLTRLIKYTKGNTKEMIKHCIQQPRAPGFKNAKALWERKYGNPYNIMTMYRKVISKPGHKSRMVMLIVSRNFVISCSSVKVLHN